MDPEARCACWRWFRPDLREKTLAERSFAKEVKSLRLGEGVNFLRLAGADEIFRVGTRTRGEHGTHGNGTGRGGQRCKFSDVIRIDGMPDTDAD